MSENNRKIVTTRKYTSPDGLVHYAATTVSTEVRMALCEDFGNFTAWMTIELELVKGDPVATCVKCNLALPHYKTSRSHLEKAKIEG